MPFANVNGIKIHYKESGSGTPIVLGHSLTLDGTMYDEAAEVLSKHFRVIQIDFRGHGESEKPECEYTIADMADDVYGVIQHLGLKETLYAGLSMGGMVGMRIAIKHPGLIRGMVLLDTSADIEERRREYEQWAEMTKDTPPNEITVGALFNALTAPEFATSGLPMVEKIRARMYANPPRPMYYATMAILRRDSILDQLGKIDVPTLVIVGEKDTALPPHLSEAIHAKIGGSELQRVPGAGHLSVCENPSYVIPRMAAFFMRCAQDPKFQNSLVMTPELKEAIALLQLSREELIAEIQNEMGGKGQGAKK